VGDDSSFWLWIGAALVAVATAFTGATATATRPEWAGAVMIFAYVMYAVAAACLACAIKGIPFPGSAIWRANRTNLPPPGRPSATIASRQITPFNHCSGIEVIEFKIDNPADSEIEIPGGGTMHVTGEAESWDAGLTDTERTALIREEATVARHRRPGLNERDPWFVPARGSRSMWAVHKVAIRRGQRAATITIQVRDSQGNSYTATDEPPEPDAF
jgi:hypothetical protein